MGGSSTSSNSTSSNDGRVNRLKTGRNVSRAYECKTCGKRFGSFQALGGHHGIHKKVELDDWINDKNFLSLSIFGPIKSSSGLHQCKICKKGFETGPALGGHMTRHRNGKDLVSTSEDVKVEVVEVGPVKAKEEDEEKERIRELMLAAKEWRLRFD